MKKDKRKKRKKRLRMKELHKRYLMHNNSKSHERRSKMNEQFTNFIMVENNEQEIISTNYWESEYAQNGYFYLSINAGAFRLLVPENQEQLINEFKTGEYCIISKGPSPSPLHPFAIELLFEDHTSTPFHLILCAGQVERNPSDRDAGKKYTLSVWKNGCNKVLEMDAYFRLVNRIPYLKPLGNEFKNVS